MNRNFLILALISFLILSCSDDKEAELELILNKSDLTLEIGEQETIEILQSPVSDQTPEWTINDASIATVLSGTVTAISSGNAIVSATVGSQTANCIVTVIPPIDDTILVTAIHIDIDSLFLSIGSSATLIATLEPVGAEGIINWSSSDTSIASVSDGHVIAHNTGLASIMATHSTFTAICIVEVSDTNSLHQSLKGSDYYIIQMDESSFGHIEDKVIHDFRPDQTNTFLYIWPDGTSFTAGSPNGLNFYGLSEDWLSLEVANLGWSGAGYFIEPGYGNIDMTDLYKNTADYVFHVALKSGQTSSGYCFIFTDGSGNEAKIVVGNVEIDGVQPYVDFTRNNEWQEVEIPVSYIQQLGVYYDQTFSDVNILAFLAGGDQGTTLDMDAVFFYKKAEE